ncbi:MAG: tyrosine-type recombinase/integrase [Anaeromyxobacteraceae bacterium]
MVEKLTKIPPLTPPRIEALRPQAGRYEVADPAAAGLRLRVLPTGTKVFRWYCTSAGRVITIGEWTKAERPGFVTLGEARRWLERLKAAHKEGRLTEVEAELRANRPRHRPEPTLAGEATFEVVAKDYFEHVATALGWRTAPEVRRAVTRDVLPSLGARPVKAITPPEVAAIVKHVAARGSRTQAGRTLAYVKGIFRFARGHGLVPSNPADALDPEALGVVENESERFLSVGEIPAFWRALDESSMAPQTRIGLRIVLLTGVRPGELLGATWDEIDTDAGTWTIPVERQKMKPKMRGRAKPFVVPLTPAVAALFEKLRHYAEGSTFVMASPNSETGRYTDKALIAAMRKLFQGEKPLLAFAEPHPTPHDLRRTVRTHLGETLGVAPHIAERCLNHSLGRIARVYDRGDYLEERREALARWAAYVERIVTPEQAKVAFLHTVRK